jgi:predicted RNase H-like HicB family nuclease
MSSSPKVPEVRIEIEREEDGRWLADVPALPGVMAYGNTSEEAVRGAQALALRVIADRLEHGEEVPAAVLKAFQPVAA